MPVLLIVAMAMVYAGFTLGQPAMAAAVTEAVPSGTEGVALGLATLVFFVGGGLGAAVAGLGPVVGHPWSLVLLASCPSLRPSPPGHPPVRRCLPSRPDRRPVAACSPRRAQSSKTRCTLCCAAWARGRITSSSMFTCDGRVTTQAIASAMSSATSGSATPA